MKEARGCLFHRSLFPFLISQSVVTDQQMKQILDVHNTLRAQVDSGGEKDTFNLPPAADMMQLEWHEQLALSAQAHSDQCMYKFDHNYEQRLGEFEIGQNLHSETSPHTLSANRTDAINQWYSERVKIATCPSSGPTFNNDTQFAGKFIQLVWARTFAIGVDTLRHSTNQDITKICTPAITAPPRISWIK